MTQVKYWEAGPGVSLEGVMKLPFYLRQLNHYSPFLRSKCYKLGQGFRVTCLFTGQYNTKGYDKITDVI